MNFETWKNQILEFIQKDRQLPALVDDKFVSCSTKNACKNCKFNSSEVDCTVNLVEQLLKCADNELNTDLDSCEHCIHDYGTSICLECRRNYPDRFIRVANKTRQGEFLKANPNAMMDQGVIDICPRYIDKDFDECKNYPVGCCSDCRRTYWSQEVE